MPQSPSRTTVKAFVQVCLSSSWGGLEIVAYDYAKSLQERGFKSWVVAPKGSPLLARCEKNNVPSIGVDIASTYFAPRASLAIRELVQHEALSDVVLHQLKDLWIVVPALTSMRAVRLLGFSHTFLKYKKKDFGHQLLYRRMETLVALTDLQKQNLLEHLPIEAKKISVIAVPVDGERFTPRKKTEAARREFSVADDQVLIALIGRLDPQKGQLETLDAAAELKRQGLKFKLLFVGEETRNSLGTKAKVMNRIQELGLQGDVVVTGYVEDLEALMASVDVFLMPSYLETFGRVIVEAMASGVAVIGTAAGGIPNIVDSGINGILIPPHDVPALITAIDQLARDRALRERFAKAGREKALSVYSYEKINRELNELFGI